MAKPRRERTPQTLYQKLSLKELLFEADLLPIGKFGDELTADAAHRRLSLSRDDEVRGVLQNGAINEEKASSETLRGRTRRMTFKSVSQTLAEASLALEKLDWPSEHRLRDKVKRIVANGCNSRYLLVASWRYGYYHDALRKYLKQNQHIDVRDRQLDLGRLRLSSRDVLDHVGRCLQIANEIRDIVEASRYTQNLMKIWDREENPDYVDFHMILRGYAHFMLMVSYYAMIPNTLKTLRDQSLRLLADHVERHTGRYHWEILVDLIDCWGLVELGSAEKLRKYYERVPTAPWARVRLNQVIRAFAREMPERQERLYRALRRQSQQPWNRRKAHKEVAAKEEAPREDRRGGGEITPVTRRTGVSAKAPHALDQMDTTLRPKN